MSQFRTAIARLETAADSILFASIPFIAAFMAVELQRGNARGGNRGQHFLAGGIDEHAHRRDEWSRGLRKGPYGLGRDVARDRRLHEPVRARGARVPPQRKRRDPHRRLHHRHAGPAAALCVWSLGCCMNCMNTLLFVLVFFFSTVWFASGRIACPPTMWPSAPTACET